MNTRLDEHLGHLQAKGCSAATLRAVRSDLKGFQTWWKQTYQRPFSTEIVAVRDIQRWRRLLLRDDQTIADLHYTLQIAMGWSDLHLNRFIIHGKQFGVYPIGA